MSSPDASPAAKSTGGLGIAGRLADAFIDSKLTPLLIIASVLLGVLATALLAREEEPQIVVPMVDVMVAMPGASAQEIEERVSRPMEQLLWEIPGVEYLYSSSRPGESLVIVRFSVGEDIEASLVKLNQKLMSNYDVIPHGASTPLIKPRSIDDVPILALTFHSASVDHELLRRLASEVNDAVKQVPRVAETTLIGGAERQVRVLLDPARLAARNLSPVGLIPVLQGHNRQYRAGALTAQNREVVVETGGFLATPEEVGAVVVGVEAGRPIYLRDVAEIVDGPAEPSQYVLFGSGAGAGEARVLEDEPAVTLTVAKRPGANAIEVARAVLAKVDTLRGRVIPANVAVTVTRHYGETAQEKSDELLFHMAIAVISVSLLILFALGFRESIIVAIAIPSTLALTLLVFYLYGFTLNRITLFALIFSIGILVDDAIVVVENIVRHFQLAPNRNRPLRAIAIEAVSEVGNPTVLATFTVIFAVVPMAFVGGLMGPYMRPIPIGAGAAMLFSLVIAFIVTPWAALRLLRRHEAAPAAVTVSEPTSAIDTAHAGPREDIFTRSYRAAMAPLLAASRVRWAFLIGIVALLLAAMATVAVGWVQVKMLPFDNKSELQLVVNAPEGSSLERTAQIAREMAATLRDEPEVANYQIYAGVAAPFSFNGLVRHYFMRRGAHVADIQVNLVPKHERDAKSHDIAKRIRPRVAAIAARYGARVAVTELPPGPPVLQTLVAEIYGPDDVSRGALAARVRDLFKSTPGVVDVDWYVEEPQSRSRFVVDRAKAALHGISAETIAATLRIAVEGAAIDLVHVPSEKDDVELVLEVPSTLRSTPQDLLSLRVRPGDANRLPEPRAMGATELVPLGELVRVEPTTIDRTRYHKNLMPVVYVIGDVAGEIESPAYAIFALNEKLKALAARDFGGSTDGAVQVWNSTQPAADHEPGIKWDGEWHITLEVFRDLGLAFAAVLVLIYVLMVGWFRSFLTPVIVMAAIPFSLVGILPAHGALGAFFTATSMIGFMAGAGIVVRNSIILVDFIELRLAEGMALADAVVDAGAVRFRPMMLTALAVVVGAGVLLLDPIFEGLAIALMAGEIASLFISRVAVPVLYFMAYRSRATRVQDHL